MHRATVWVGVVAWLAAAAVGCEDKAKASAEPAASVEQKPSKPKVALGGSCQANEDCDDGLGCAKDSTCQTYKTIECRGRDDTCGQEGRCTGSDKGCIAGSNDDCKNSEICTKKGRCSAKEGKCAATSDADCATICKTEGRCTLEGDECIAAEDSDCKKSQVCEKYEKCVARQGACWKKNK